MPLTTLDTAHTATCQLVALFEANAAHYSSSSYQEAEVRKDFLDKFFVALGWDVNHDAQTNPYEQEVKIEKPVKTGESKRRADYAFYLAPQFRNPAFLVEAKRVQHDLGTPQNYFQAIRYSWNHQLPFVVLSDFRTFHLIDSRYKPDITSALQQKIAVYTLSDYLDRDKFAEIYWIFSREAVADGSITKRSRELGAPNTTARQLTLFAKGFQPIDEVFLEQLDQYRSTLAYSFKALNTHLTGEQLTEAVQRTLDRLVFIRFLEDKQIEPNAIVSTFGSKRSPWKDFVAESKRLDAIYNGVVFKSHALIDAPNFSVDEHEFLQICDELSNQHSPYDFNSIPIEILGRIYERFLGKIISASATKATVEDKLSVQRAGGVYYTPDHIVQYMVDNSLGPQARNKSADDILKLRIIDTSCGSGSFLIGVFDRLIRDVTKYFIEHPTMVKHGDTIERDGSVHLSLKKKREILLGCIYGIDIDAQAVEVAQLSLYLKLLEEESGHFRRGQREIKDAALLPSLNKNILVGNSLVSPSTQRSTEGLFDFALYEASKAIDIAGAFPKIMKDNDGFDLVIGNPPYIKEYVNRDAFTYVRDSTYYQGKMDIWYLFACRGLDLLRPNGTLAFIATNNWGTAFGAKLLRAKIAKDARIDQLIDFGNFKVFKNASIQTMILIARRYAKGASYKFDYRYLNGRAPDRQEMIELLRRRPGDNLSYLSPRFDRTALSNSFFTFSAPSFEKILNKLGKAGSFRLASEEIAQGIVPPQDFLNAEAAEKLGGNLKVGAGIFNLSESELQRLQLSYAERQLVRPFYTTQQLGRYWGDTRNELWIIYTDSVFAQPRAMEAFPRLREHLDQFAPILTSAYKPYGLHRARDADLFLGEKILSVRKAAQPTFTFVNFPCYVSQSFNIIKTERMNLKYLTAILNSTLLRFWFKNRAKMQGHQYQVDSAPLTMAPIADAETSLQLRLAAQVDLILTASAKLSVAVTDPQRNAMQRVIDDAERQIQGHIYMIYGLSPAEVAEVEDALSDADV